jgi:hypothetical protein
MTTKPTAGIYSDDICVYVSVSANNGLTGKIALALADLLVFIVLYFAIIEWIPGLLICTLLLLMLLTRFTLWSFFGKENLIINTKSVSYQNDYGFFKTPYTTKLIKNKLVVVNHKTDEPEGYVNCGFITYDATDLPVDIYDMVFPISAEDSIYMQGLIEHLYLNKLSDNYDFPVINLN